MSRFREEEDISEAWRSKFHTGEAAFHVPLPSIADHNEDLARIMKSSPRVSYRGVVVPNHKIRATIEYLPEPVIRLRKKEDNS